MVKTERPRGHPSKQEAPTTEDQVLRAALHAFATDGFNGVSVRTLSSELGVSHNLLHQRFGSKDALWRACAHSCGPSPASQPNTPTSSG
jgi:AcrR family transcriptional regulator